MKREVFIFREFEKIGKNKKVTSKIYKKLEKFIIENKLDEKYNFFKIDRDNIIVQNFIGTIIFDDIQIDILPKIPLIKNNIIEEKKRFLEILQNVDYFKEIKFDNIEISTENTSILEIFISNFIKEVNKIIKNGLVYHYREISENTSFFKGKLNIIENIKSNFIHKEKFNISYDKFSISSPENCLIKLALEKLFKISINDKNKKELKKLLHFFSPVEILFTKLDNIKNIVFNKQNAYYKEAVKWSNIFLKNESPTIFSADNEEIISFFFPMEVIYENYIANKLNEIIKKKFKELKIKIQDDSCSVFSSYYINEINKLEYIFKLKPDIIIENLSNKKIIIMDTKWKILDKEEEKFGITSENVYQMLSYVRTYDFNYKKNFNCEEAYLIYPEKNFFSDEIIKFQAEKFNLNICFVDLSSESSVENSLKKIIEKHIKVQFS